MDTLVFGHKAPDTDSTGSPIAWAWYLNEIKSTPAQAVLLGPPNTEAAFVLERWGLARPRIIDRLDAGQPVVIVDTNNPAELPASIAHADIRAIIDHHKLTGGLQTKGPIDVTLRPLACTATIMADMMGDSLGAAPASIKGAMLSCILSDTLDFRSPTTTDHDRAVAQRLAADLDVDASALAQEMFTAKSDISALSDIELLRMDRKEYTVQGVTFCVSVLETMAPDMVLARKGSLMAALETARSEMGVDQVLFFVVDILRQQATLLVNNARAKAVAEKSFGASVEGDTVVLPGVVSRKKQIIPHLAF